MKRDRFKWIKIEKVYVRALAHEPIPAGAIFVEMRETMFRPATEFKVIVRRDATEGLPSVHDGVLAGSPRLPNRGSLVIDNSLPFTVAVDVFFEQEGIFDIVGEIAVKDDGWLKRNPIQVTRPIRVACVSRPKKVMPKSEPVKDPKKT